MNSLTPKEVADMLKITTNTVYELVKRGELNAYRIGRKMRIDPKDVEKYKKRTSTGIFKSDENTDMQINDDSIDMNSRIVICGNDIILDILVKYLELKNMGIPVFRSYLGSYNGLYALYQGNAHLATSHLWDGDTGEYNKDYIKRMVPGIPTIAIHLACRIQGFYVKKGNPIDINGWDDLKRPEIRIVNREKGSGTRVLLDEQLRLLNVFGVQIKGYERESISDIGTASMVARGEADLALGKEMAAIQVEGVDFIPLHKESIEIVMKKEDFPKLPFRMVMDILTSREFLNEIQGIEGYDIKGIGKILFET